MQHALYLPPFGELADPRALADVGAAAEENGWHGVFLWDHVLRPPDDPPEVADAWIGLAAMAAATSRIRLGPLVTPVVRRRPQKLAREIVSLDLLAGGRLICGFGLGVDDGRELSGFGEVVDARDRGDLLDEGVALVDALLSGEEVHHDGPHYVADGVQFLPRAVQRPRPPFWFASRGDARRPVRRAARYEGLFPIEIGVDQFARVVELVVAERGSLDGFDLAVVTIPGLDLEPYQSRGATWAMHSFLPGTTVTEAIDYASEYAPT